MQEVRQIVAGHEWHKVKTFPLFNKPFRLFSMSKAYLCHSNLSAFAPSLRALLYKKTTKVPRNLAWLFEFSCKIRPCPMRATTEQMLHYRRMPRIGQAPLWEFNIILFTMVPGVTFAFGLLHPWLQSDAPPGLRAVALRPAWSPGRACDCSQG
jgi:hypothetical protein